MSYSHQDLSTVRHRLLRCCRCRFKLHLRSHWANFKQTWHKASLGDRDSSLFKWRTMSFPRGDNSEIVKLYWKHLKIFFRTTGLMPLNLTQSILWWRRLKLFKWRATPPPREGMHSKKVIYFENISKLSAGERWGPWASCFLNIPTVDNLTFMLYFDSSFHFFPDQQERH